MNSENDLWCKVAYWPYRYFWRAITLLFLLPVSLSLVGVFQYYSINEKYLLQKINEDQQTLALRVIQWLKLNAQQLSQDIARVSSQPVSCPQNPITLLWRESEYISQQYEAQGVMRIRSTQLFPDLLTLLQTMANCSVPVLSLDIQIQEMRLVSEWLLESEP